MTTYTLPVAVTVDLRADGADLSGVYGPGNVELPEPVAVLLLAQGHAKRGKGSSSKATPELTADPEEAAPVVASSTKPDTED